MTKVSRREFFKRLRSSPSPTPTEATATPTHPEQESVLVTTDAGRAWQAEQGEQAEAGALPGVISWLNKYVDDDSEPALPVRAKTIPYLRPPGAIEEQDFLATCTQCGDCQRACPHDAIRVVDRQGQSAAPWIDPSESPCHFCEDLPCISVCEPRALRIDAGHQMGRAHINGIDCLNSMGMQCTVCQEKCPVDDVIQFSGGLPKASEFLCVGCGLCHFACPAPNNPIAILPNNARISPSEGDSLVHE